MPRNRTARVAVLGSSVQRAASPYPTRARSALKRRIVVTCLALLSVALITAHFRESPNGALHDVQNVGATVLRPFQVAGERVARPFRDAYGYFAGLVGAKAENEELRATIDELRRQMIENETAAQELRELRQAFDFHDLPALRDYKRVNARVISHPPMQFGRQLVIAAGSDAGITRHSPVISQSVLVGEVTAVTPGTAQVTLLTDGSSAVSARDLRTGAIGIVEAGPGDALYLTRVDKARDVRKGDLVVTAGSRVVRLPSLYPSGIMIGEVTSVGQTDTDPFKQIQVTPYVDLSDLTAVTVLVRQRRR